MSTISRNLEVDNGMILTIVQTTGKDRQQSTKINYHEAAIFTLIVSGKSLELLTGVFLWAYQRPQPDDHIFFGKTETTTLSFFLVVMMVM